MRQFKLALAFCVFVMHPTQAQDSIRDAVVKIHATNRPPDFARPWTKGQSSQSSGSGVIIDGQRILTNAHVVHYATRLYVQANQSSERKPASVVAVAQEMDLAVITVDDKQFFDDRPALPLSADIPKLKDTVNVYGYPIGGEQMSITEGIVSRIEAAQYVLDGFGLRIQVDAALNPGNSGGPAVADGKVVGLVFSGIRDAENIGYLIPAEEVSTFLSDIEDGSYEGKPRLFDEFQTVENDALREKLRLQPQQGGMMVTRPFRDDVDYPLKKFDVITRVGDQELDRQGNVRIKDDLKLTFQYLVPKVAQDEKLKVTILRDGNSLDLQIPVFPHREWLIPPLKGKYPSHFVLGPMVFTTASQDLLALLLRGPAQLMLTVRNSPLPKRRMDKPDTPGEELVVLGPRLFPHHIAEGYDSQSFAVVSHVNDVKIKNLAHLVETCQSCEDEYLVVELEGAYETMVFRRQELLDSTEEILEDEGIRFQFSEDLREIWQGKKSG